MNKTVSHNDYCQINTYDPFQSLPRITEFFHSTVKKGYYSCGRFRKNENHCIFHYTLRGNGETWINEKYYKTAPGIGFLNIINNENSGYQYPVDSDNDWEFIVLCFDYGNTRDIVSELINSYGPLYNIRLELMQQMLSKYALSHDNILSKADSFSFFSSLISTLVESAENYISSIAPTMIQKVKDTINKNIKDSITVNMLSRELNFSREYLSRTFSKYTGESLKSYISKQQLSHICHLLKNTDMTVKEIATDMNFSSISNLSLFFKKHTGLTLIQYRKFGNYPT